VTAPSTTTLAAADLVIALSIGPQTHDMSALTRWLAVDADEQIVLQHVLYAARMPGSEQLDVMEQLVDAALVLLRRFR
jgi:hypothetical protein